MVDFSVRISRGLSTVVVAELLTLALMSTWFAGTRLAGLPFAPFDAFDWLSRRLPGSVITFSIETMVAAIRRLGVTDTAAAAKLTEQILAAIVVLAGGAVTGLVVSRAARRGVRVIAVVGTLAGTVWGVLLAIASARMSRSAVVSPWLAGAWIFASCAVWGAVLGWSLARMAPDGRAGAAVARTTPSVDRIDRRRFIVRVGGASAAITVCGAVLGALARRRPGTPRGERWSAHNPLPNTGSPLTPAPGTRPEFTPIEDHYRIDINTVVPAIDGDRWRLSIAGLVDRPLVLTLDELRAREPLHQFVTLACISNPVGGGLIGTTRWTGASLQQLLPELGLRDTATHLKLTAADGFFEVVALDEIRRDARIMLAYAWDGVPLAPAHGYPLRIYLPDRYGMKQPKWIEKIEAIDHWQPGFWVVRGWDREANMKATSVIDTIAVDDSFTGPNGETLIPVGGIAHAGARGISRVELRVDRGEWMTAEIRQPLSSLTWVVWRFDLPLPSGDHTLTVRCIDGNGQTQIETPAPPHPSGASGLHRKRIRSRSA